MPSKRSEMTDTEQSDSQRHRVVVEFDGGTFTRKLIHPEGACVTADRCGQCGRPFDADTEEWGDGPCYDCKPPIPDAYRECWVQGWFDNEGADLLSGQIELVVEEEYDFDHCTLHVVGVAMPEGTRS